MSYSYYDLEHRGQTPPTSLDKMSIHNHRLKFDKVRKRIRRSMELTPKDKQYVEIGMWKVRSRALNPPVEKRSNGEGIRGVENAVANSNGGKSAPQENVQHGNVENNNTGRNNTKSDRMENHSAEIQNTTKEEKRKEVKNGNPNCGPICKAIHATYPVHSSPDTVSSAPKLQNS